MRSLKQALKFNETQFGTVFILTALNLAACLSSIRINPWWVWVIALLFWPVFAVIGNLVLGTSEE